MRIAYGKMGPPAETASSNLPAPPAMISPFLEVSQDDTPLFKAQSLTLHSSSYLKTPTNTTFSTNFVSL